MSPLTGFSSCFVGSAKNNLIFSWRWPTSPTSRAWTRLLQKKRKKDTWKQFSSRCPEKQCILYMLLKSKVQSEVESWPASRLNRKSVSRKKGSHTVSSAGGHCCKVFETNFFWLILYELKMFSVLNNSCGPFPMSKAGHAGHCLAFLSYLDFQKRSLEHANLSGCGKSIGKCTRPWDPAGDHLFVGELRLLLVGTVLSSRMRAANKQWLFGEHRYLFTFSWIHVHASWASMSSLGCNKLPYRCDVTSVFTA